MGREKESKELAKFLVLEVFGYKMKTSVVTELEDDENPLHFELNDGSSSSKTFKTEDTVANHVPPSKVWCDLSKLDSICNSLGSGDVWVEICVQLGVESYLLQVLCSITFRTVWEADYLFFNWGLHWSFDYVEPQVSCNWHWFLSESANFSGKPQLELWNFASQLRMAKSLSHPPHQQWCLPTFRGTGWRSWRRIFTTK